MKPTTTFLLFLFLGIALTITLPHVLAQSAPDCDKGGGCVEQGRSSQSRDQCPNCLTLDCGGWLWPTTPCTNCVGPSYNDGYCFDTDICGLYGNCPAYWA